MPAPTQTNVPDDPLLRSWAENFEPLYEWPELVRKLPPKEQ
jgi:hypothetical protein